GTNNPGTSLRFFQQELESVWSHNWDSQRHWRSVTRFGLQFNQDNGPGFYNFRRYLAAEQLRYVASPWEFKVQGRISYYDFQHQLAVPDSADTDLRQKAVVGVSARGERKVGKQFMLFAEYEYERSLSNRSVEEYHANKVTGGMGWEF